MNVRDCMCANVCTTVPGASILEAARLMKELDAGVLPVGENDRLVGMITDRDIALRGVGEGRSPDAPVIDVMTREIQYVFDDEPLDEAAAKMSELKVRRLPVLNRQKRLVGILSLGDIAQSAEETPLRTALRGVTEPGGPHTHH